MTYQKCDGESKKDNHFVPQAYYRQWVRDGKTFVYRRSTTSRALGGESTFCWLDRWCSLKAGSWAVYFWVRVRGYAFNHENPYELAAWAFVDLSPSDRDNRVAASLTKREHDDAALVISGGTSKEIGKELHISSPTVDIHRASLLKKYGVNTAADLIKKLFD